MDKIHKQKIEKWEMNTLKSAEHYWSVGKRKLKPP